MIYKISFIHIHDLWLDGILILIIIFFQINLNSKYFNRRIKAISKSSQENQMKFKKDLITSKLKIKAPQIRTFSSSNFDYLYVAPEESFSSYFSFSFYSSEFSSSLSSKSVIYSSSSFSYGYSSQSSYTSSSFSSSSDSSGSSYSSNSQSTPASGSFAFVYVTSPH